MYRETGETVSVVDGGEGEEGGGNARAKCTERPRSVSWWGGRSARGEGESRAVLRRYGKLRGASAVGNSRGARRLCRRRPHQRSRAWQVWLNSRGGSSDRITSYYRQADRGPDIPARGFSKSRARNTLGGRPLFYYDYYYYYHGMTSATTVQVRAPTRCLPPPPPLYLRPFYPSPLPRSPHCNVRF